MKELKNILWDEIESIEEVEIEDCYDITLLESDVYLNEPNFIAEDFIVHNSGMAQEYIKRKKGLIEYSIHPIMESIIGNTYGTIIFQEQLMQIMNKVGLISLQDCDDIRKAMGKKQVDRFMKYKPIFLENGQRILGWKKHADKIKNSNYVKDSSEPEYIIQDKEDSVEGLWEQMITFARYGFNRSHSVSYSILSARELYLKTHYQKEYYSAVLSHLKTGDKRIKIYIQDGRKKGLKFGPLDINKSKLGFEIIDGEIVIGFDKVKGISKEASKLVELQPFKSIDDFIERYGAGKRVGETLIKTGAFNSFEKNMMVLLKYFEYRRENKQIEKGMNRIEFGRMYKCLTQSKSCPRPMTDQLAALIEEDKKKIPYKKLINLIKNGKFEFTEIDNDILLNYVELKKDDFQKNAIDLDEFKTQEHIRAMEDFSDQEKSELESELYTFYFNHPLDAYKRESETDLEELLRNKVLGRVEAIITDVERRTTKKGNPFYIITLEDEFEQAGVLLWNNQYTMYRDLIYNGSAIRIDIQPSTYYTWNLTRMGEIVKMRKLEEPTEEEESEARGDLEYQNLIEELKRI